MSVRVWQRQSQWQPMVHSLLVGHRLRVLFPAAQVWKRKRRAGTSKVQRVYVGKIPCLIHDTTFLSPQWRPRSTPDSRVELARSYRKPETIISCWDTVRKKRKSIPSQSECTSLKYRRKFSSS